MNLPFPNVLCVQTSAQQNACRLGSSISYTSRSAVLLRNWGFTLDGLGFGAMDGQVRSHADCAVGEWVCVCLCVSMCVCVCGLCICVSVCVGDFKSIAHAVSVLVVRECCSRAILSIYYTVYAPPKSAHPYGLANHFECSHQLSV